ncbi:hypothetical protein BDR04DRAFT_1163407 [Suillus decipiens]|nr:hypothetical protein BDR04DRAFT_1163407 [Suillus decipiens]
MVSDIDDLILLGHTGGSKPYMMMPARKRKLAEVEEEDFTLANLGLCRDDLVMADITHPVTGEQNNMLILLHAKYTHICKDMLTEKGVINLTKFKLIVHLGNILYA